MSLSGFHLEKTQSEFGLENQCDIEGVTMGGQYRWRDSPLGKIALVATDRALTGVYLQGQKYFPELAAMTEMVGRSAILDLAQTQLTEYFARQRQQFDLPLAPTGTEFQRQIWQLLQRIPYGETISYGQLAEWYGQPNAARAVGAANGRNPISIIVPCHRVVATSGKLTGYASGLDRKQWLLQHENPSSAPLQPTIMQGLHHQCINQRFTRLDSLVYRELGN